jgi:hypothetical protein
MIDETDNFDRVLEAFIARTGVERYRYLCSEQHPDHAAWRRWVLEQESGYPPLSAMAGDALKAAGRVAAAAVRREPIRVPADVLERRRAICGACEHLDPGAARCRLCGCHTNIKLHIQTEKCPIGKW